MKLETGAVCLDEFNGIPFSAEVIGQAKLIGKIEEFVQGRTAKIAIDQNNRLPRLGADDGEIIDRGRLALAGAAAQHAQGWPDAVLDLEIELGAQNSVAFRMGQAGGFGRSAA